MKVYCKNCKFYGVYIETTRGVGYVTQRIYCDPGKTLKFNGFQPIYNKDNFLRCDNEPIECEHYKRKWYKFWITQGSIR